MTRPPTTPKPHRRQLQFSLRTLLMLVLAASVALSWSGVQVLKLNRLRNLVPLDVRLGLGTEGFCPAVLAKAVRQASKASSFVEASDALQELADLEISPTHLQRLNEQIGEEWVEVRDEEVEKFRQAELERSYKEPPSGAPAEAAPDG